MTCCTIIGIAGASGSGKTLLANTLVAELSEKYGVDSISVICEDYYYRDQSDVPMAERVNVNYDHPNSMDHDLMTLQLQELKAGRSVEMPQYDYCEHTRSAKSVHMSPKNVIVVEGILLFTDANLRKCMDYLIFVDTPLDICLIRRVTRDMEERCRSFESIIKQYQATVRPMYWQFIEPSRRWADLIVPSWKDNRVAIEVLKAKISNHLD